MENFWQGHGRWTNLKSAIHLCIGYRFYESKDITLFSTDTERRGVSGTDAPLLRIKVVDAIAHAFARA